MRVLCTPAAKKGDVTLFHGARMDQAGSVCTTYSVLRAQQQCWQACNQAQPVLTLAQAEVQAAGDVVLEGAGSAIVHHPTCSGIPAT